jgi:Mg-chelatase subunit ChlD
MEESTMTGISRRAWMCMAAGGLVAGQALGQAADIAPRPVPPVAKPRVEVVFVLDTTGSMGGLIAGAKAKIWAIVNQIAGGKPTPAVKVGLVGFRDKRDAYVTQVFDLTADIDLIHEKLMGFQAQGGGDHPEHVNQALHDAVHKINWSKERGVVKIMFLVGDAPPHMDYTDDVKYPETCKAAVLKNIRINTVQCGNDTQCRTAWADIAGKSEGEYVQISQDGGVVAVATPHDAELARLNSELVGKTLVYGSRERQAADGRKLEAARALSESAPAAAADRAAFAGKGGGSGAAFDLLDAIKGGSVKLDDLKDDELPEQLRKLSKDERVKFLKDLEEQRDKLRKRILELDKQRSAFIQSKLAETRGKDGFDAQVLKILQKQAKDGGVQY